MTTFLVYGKIPCAITFVGEVEIAKREIYTLSVRKGSVVRIEKSDLIELIEAQGLKVPTIDEVLASPELPMGEYLKLSPKFWAAGREAQRKAMVEEKRKRRSEMALRGEEATATFATVSKDWYGNKE